MYEDTHIADVCMHTPMGSYSTPMYMRVHLYYDVCALYNAACIREESVKDVYSGLYMCICSSITQGPAWMESHFPCLLWPDTPKLCQKSEKSPFAIEKYSPTHLIYI